MSYFDQKNIYFSHDANARNDIKLKGLRRLFGLDGYAVYFIIVEMLREQRNFKLPNSELTRLAIADECNKDVDDIIAIVDKCVEFELLSITDDDEFLYSESLIRRLQPLLEKSKLMSINAQKRWNKSPITTDEDINEEDGRLKTKSFTKSDEAVLRRKRTNAEVTNVVKTYNDDLTVSDATAMQLHSDSNADAIHKKKKKNKKKEEEEQVRRRRKSSSSSNKPFLLLKDKTKYYIDIEQMYELEQKYPNVFVPAEIELMANWTVANPRKRKTRTGIKRFINNWLIQESRKDTNANKKSKRDFQFDYEKEKREYDDLVTILKDKETNDDIDT